MATRAGTQTVKPIRELYLSREVEGLIGRSLSPMVLVNETDKKGKFYRRDDSNIVLENDSVLSSKGGANETSHGYNTDTYNIITHGLVEWVDGDVYNFADPVVKANAREDAIMNIKDKLEIIREKKLASILFNASNFTGNTSTLSGTNQWDNPASDPLANFITAAKSVKKGGKNLNALILGYEAMLGLQFNPAILDLLGDNSTKAVTRAVLSQMLMANGVNIPESNIFVGEAQYKVDLDSDPLYIWGKDALFCYIDQKQITKKGDTLIKTFGLLGNSGDSYKYYDDWNKSKKGEWAFGQTAYDHKIINNDLGYLFKSAVS